MPNTKSAIKRTKKTQAQSLVNKVRKSKYKLAIKKMQAYIDAKKMKEAQSFFPKFHSQLMKIVKTKIVSKKTASRKISRINKKITNSLKNK
jgi:small subunit ribosomal protein S20